MIYTVGIKINYDFHLHRAQHEPSDFLKRGPYGGFFGGIVFKTSEEALEFLIKTGNLGTYSVYGVEADWDRDTIPDKNVLNTYHRLQRDAKIVQLKKGH